MIRVLLILISFLPFNKEKLPGRVQVAKTEKEAIVKKYVDKVGLHFPLADVFIRVFKQDNALELWGKDDKSTGYTLVHTYEICAKSGTLGPKRQQGDGQVPEGFYKLRDYNPASSYYLSMGVNYPNKSDEIRKTNPDAGGAIYIHGDCVTIGCMPMTDDKIKEIYWLCYSHTLAYPQRSIAIHIFPFQFNVSNMKKYSAEYSEHQSFWKELRPGYKYFELNKKLLNITYSSKGAYQLKQ